MYEFLDRRYAQALYDVCEKAGNVEQTLEDLSVIVESMETGDELRKIIEHPQIHRPEKKKIITNLFKDQVSPELLDFLILLIEKDRFLYLKEKYNQLRLIYLEHHNTVEVEIRSARPLSDAQKKSLKEKLEKKYNKEIIFSEKVDKSLIGGMFIKVGDDVIDGTIKSRIEAMKGIMENKQDTNLYKEEEEKPLLAKITTIQPLTEDQKEDIIIKLENFYDRKFVIEEKIDKGILGGIHIVVGDDVIDATIKGKLIELGRINFSSKDNLIDTFDKNLKG